MPRPYEMVCRRLAGGIRRMRVVPGLFRKLTGCAKRAVYFVSRYVLKQKIGANCTLVLQRNLKETYRAYYIRKHKRLRIVDRPVNMALRREMHDCIWLEVPEQIPHGGLIANIDLGEPDLGIIGSVFDTSDLRRRKRIYSGVFQRFRTAGVRQAVQNKHLGKRVFRQTSYERGANKTASACYYITLYHMILDASAAAARRHIFVEYPDKLRHRRGYFSRIVFFIEHKLPVAMTDAFRPVFVERHAAAGRPESGICRRNLSGLLLVLPEELRTE